MNLHPDMLATWRAFLGKLGVTAECSPAFFSPSDEQLVDAANYLQLSSRAIADGDFKLGILIKILFLNPKAQQILALLEKIFDRHLAKGALLLLAQNQRDSDEKEELIKYSLDLYVAFQKKVLLVNMDGFPTVSDTFRRFLRNNADLQLMVLALSKLPTEQYEN